MSLLQASKYTKQVFYIHIHIHSHGKFSSSNEDCIMRCMNGESSSDDNESSLTLNCAIKIVENSYIDILVYPGGHVKLRPPST